MNKPEYADIKLGFSCNNDCIHCVIADKRRNLQKNKKKIDRSTEEVKQQISEAHKDGVKRITLTGGEVTIRNDFFEILRFASSLGLGINLQSNGRAFSYENFAKEAANAAKVTYTIALNGSTPELTDNITRAKGSFEQTKKGIENLIKLGQNVSGKIVISKFNYKYLTEIVKIFKKAGITRGINIAFPHGQGNALLNFDQVVPKYTDLEPYIHEVIEYTYKEGLRSYVDFEAIPFCFLKGYENHVSELRLKSGQLRDMEHINLDYSQTRKNIAKKKGPKCKECKVFTICEGPWIEYPEHFGFDEFKPIKD